MHSAAAIYSNLLLFFFGLRTYCYGRRAGNFFFGFLCASLSLSHSALVGKSRAIAAINSLKERSATRASEEEKLVALYSLAASV
jgi:hypothetical protein